MTLILSVSTSHAENSAETNKSTSDNKPQATEDHIVVTGHSNAGPKFDLKSTQTTFDLEAIQNLQPSSIFDILSNVPGVDLTGGPRANGISINIRGFADNEDTLIIIDGAVKNFEKYRFGSVLPEPELLRELTVSRGPASVLQGSGAIGGVIEMETKNADDFLEPGDNFGGFVKGGYADNNDERLGIATIYGRTDDDTGMLFSITKRNSNNKELSTGDDLLFSESDPLAVLSKIEWNTENSLLGLAYSHTKTEGLELFDTSAANNGVNGQVFRETQDHTLSSYYKYNPPSRWLDSSFGLAFTDTVVDEIAVTPTGDLLDRGWDYQYYIWSARMHNKATLFTTSNQKLMLDVGIQALEEERQTIITDINGDVSEDAELSQPSGVTLNWGSYLQATWELYNLTTTVGYREDHSDTEVLENGSRELMISNGLPTKIRQNEGLLNYRLDLDLGFVPVTLFHSYVEGVRYPKIDEYFTQSTFSRCLNTANPAEATVSFLQGSEQSRDLGITNANTNAANTLSEFTTGEIARRDTQINALNAQRDAWIVAGMAAVTNGDWTQAEYDSNFAIVDADTNDAIALANSTATTNINVATTLINNSLASTVAGLESNHLNNLNDAGLTTSDNLYALSYPSKTTLPDPYESLQFCGALYEPERVQNVEWGLSYEDTRVITGSDSVELKLTYFETDVDNLLESINTNPADPASQPGKEKVWGYEFESTYIIDGWRFDLNYNRSKGEISGYRIVDNPNSTPSVLDDTTYQYQTFEKLDMPADEVSLTTSWINDDLTLELSLRYTHKFARNALEFINDTSTSVITVKQDPIQELDFFSMWEPVVNTHLRFSIENVTNESYKTPSGISETGDLVLGNYNTGRIIKLSATQYF